MIFVSSHQSSEILQPREQPFDSPASRITTQTATVLSGRSDAITSMRCDHFNVLLCERFIQRIAIVGQVTNQALRFILNKALLQGSFDKGDFMRRSTLCVNGERNTSAVCHCHELRTLAALSFADGAAPFLAPTKVPSMKHSARSSLPRLRKSSASASSTWRSTPERTHCWKRRWQVWYDGKRSGKSCQRAPERSIHKIPFMTSRSSFGGLPRPSALRSCLGSSGSITFHCSSFNSSRRAMVSPRQYEPRQTYHLFR